MSHPPESGRVRIGSVASLNTVPLTWGIESEVRFTTPAHLAELLRREALDAALVSVSEVLLTGRYDALDGFGVASRGAVQSVFLAHRIPLERLCEIHCDPASLTSVNLVRVLLAERGVRPAFTRLAAYDRAGTVDAVLLIGDRALDFARAPHDHQIWDLGQAWLDHTGLPFVFAVWALRRGGADEPLRTRLRNVAERGLAALEEIIRTRPEYDVAFRRAYFRDHLRFRLGADEKRGVAHFAALLERHGAERTHPLVWLD